MNFGWFLILNIEIKQHMHTNKDVDEQMLSIYQNITKIVKHLKFSNSIRNVLKSNQFSLRK